MMVATVRAARPQRAPGQITPARFTAATDFDLSVADPAEHIHIGIGQDGTVPRL
jgi:hypothetical protein